MVLKTLIALQAVAAICVIATIVLQSGRSAGLSGSIAGGAQALFGKKKGLDELLGRMTAMSAAAFLVLALLVAIIS